MCVLCGTVAGGLTGAATATPVTPIVDGGGGDVLEHPLALKNELYEALARMSGGDVASIHIDRAMDLLASLASTSDPDIGRMIRHLGPRDGLERGVLAAVLHHAMDENGRKEELEFVAAVCGASRADALRAEKILELGRGYTHNADVRMSIVLSTQHLSELPPSWLAVLRSAMTEAAQEAFCDLDTLVCAVAVYLARSIKRRLHADESAAVRGEMMRSLRRLSIRRLTELHLVSASAVRRAIGALSAEVRAIIDDNVEILRPVAAAAAAAAASLSN